MKKELILAAAAILVSFSLTGCVKVIDKGTEGQYTGEVAFDASADSSGDWGQISQEITDNAKEIGSVLSGDGIGTVSAVSGTGEVTEFITKGPKNILAVKIDGYDGDETFMIQIGSVYSGTAIRDMQTVKSFESFTNQTEWSAYAKALNAVMKDLEKQNIEKIICLGDLIGGAPMSEEVVQKIIEIKDKLIIVRGNRERYIIEGMPKVVHDEKIEVSKEQHERFKWLENSLSDSSKKYIHTLPKELTYEVEGKKIYICHYPMKKDGNFRQHVKNATPEENEVMFEGIDADIYLYGHTHEEIYNNINNKMYINPGALGCPR